MRTLGFIKLAAAVVAVVCVVAGETSYAQTQTLDDSQPPVAESRGRSRFVISARAGAINLVAGRAILKKRSGGEAPLTTSVDLAAGDVVETGHNGSVEILLAPGSYFRVGTSSTVEMLDTSLEHVRLRVADGSAIAEITADAKNSPTEIQTPHGPILLAKKGLYRVNVRRDATELMVRKGEVRVGSKEREIKVKKNEILTMSGSGDLVAYNKSSFDKNSQDVFDTWSRERAQSLVAMNRQLGNREVNNALTSYLSSNRYWPSRYSPYGLWVYDSFLGTRTFLPFYAGWGSPYGFGYRASLGWPQGYYYPGGPIYYRPVYPRPDRGTRPVMPSPRSSENPGRYKNPSPRSNPRPIGGGARHKQRSQ
ncbi:MAG TPA: FecR family protein [Pyrinomonadaceae bacterium]|nr:FecR family protein [Pyrinomonadaceae bacterium]